MEPAVPLPSPRRGRSVVLHRLSLACAGPTMVRALSERRPVQLGEVVVVQGSGPVVLAAAALAQLAGAARAFRRVVRVYRNRAENCHTTTRATNDKDLPGTGRGQSV